MRSKKVYEGNRASGGLKVATGAALVFMYFPLLIVILYAFTTEKFILSIPAARFDDALVQRFIGWADSVYPGAGCSKDRRTPSAKLPVRPQSPGFLGVTRTFVAFGPSYAWSRWSVLSA